MNNKLNIIPKEPDQVWPIIYNNKEYILSIMNGKWFVSFDMITYSFTPIKGNVNCGICKEQSIRGISTICLVYRIAHSHRNYLVLHMKRAARKDAF